MTDSQALSAVEWPCCRHCGPPRTEGAEFGSGYGHEQPCKECQVADAFDPMEVSRG